MKLIPAGFYEYLSPDGFYTKGTLLQVLRFTSITLLALHRTLRPANRLDPMRTVLGRCLRLYTGM